MGQDYQLLKELGVGSYGTVVQALHLPTGKAVAIKKLDDIFRNVLDAKRCLREIQILRSMPRHPNVVKVYDVIEPTEQSTSFRDLYFVFEY